MNDTTRPTLLVTGRGLPLHTLAGFARRLGMNVVGGVAEAVPAPSNAAPFYWAGGDSPDARPPCPGTVAVESLEHFARLTGQDLSAEEWPVALYELDGCAGLAAAGVPFERARELAAEDLRLRSGSTGIERAAEELAGMIRELHDLGLACVPFDRFEVLAAAAGSATRDAWNPWRKPPNSAAPSTSVSAGAGTAPGFAPCSGPAIQGESSTNWSPACWEPPS